jgi:hypothetical protein
MCDQCQISEKIAELDNERQEQQKNQHWQIFDLDVRRSYLGSRSFATKEEAEMMLADLLKYHMNTPWANRLVVLPGCQLSQKIILYNDNRKNNGRPKGCQGRYPKNRYPKAKGVDYGLRMDYK